MSFLPPGQCSVVDGGSDVSVDGSFLANGMLFVPKGKAPSVHKLGDFVWEWAEVRVFLNNVLRRIFS